MIVLDNVSMTYPGGNTALEDINIKIEKGEFVFIVGNIVIFRIQITAKVPYCARTTRGSHV